MALQQRSANEVTRLNGHSGSFLMKRNRDVNLNKTVGGRMTKIQSGVDALIDPTTSLELLARESSESYRRAHAEIATILTPPS